MAGQVAPLTGRDSWTSPGNKVAVILIGDKVADMVAAAHACGISPSAMRTYSKILSSDIPYERDLAALQPDHIWVALPKASVGSEARAARSRRIIVRLFLAQKEAGRHCLLYGSQKSPFWDEQEIMDLLKMEGIHQMRFRWCNMGARSSVSGLGVRAVTRICSTMQLWVGPPEASARCRCTDHAP